MRAVEIFCGAGGMSRGLVDAGFEVVKAYDAWPVAVQNYRHNVGRHVEIADLANLLSVVPEICNLSPDLICGGPPCQDYSVAGRRREAQNASLTTAFAVIVTTARPQWFIMENVIPASKSEVWAEARNMLKRAGYGLSESKINAAHYGVPQARRRLFVVGRLGERDGFLQSAIAGVASAEPMTVRDLFDPATPKNPSLQHYDVCSGSDQLMDKSSSSSKPVQRHPISHSEDAELIRNGYFYCRPLRDGRGVRKIDEPAATISRTSWERLTSRYMNSPHPNDPVPASEAVELSRRQISRIQGFPEAWEWIAGTRQDIYQMIANAIPAPVAKTIGEVILARQAGQTMPAIEGRFRSWLLRAGYTKAVARNIKANVNRARRLLGGRTYSDSAMEIVALEAVPEFDALSKGIRSDLRKALRLYSEFLGSNKLRARLSKKTALTAGMDENPELANVA